MHVLVGRFPGILSVQSGWASWEPSTSRMVAVEKSNSEFQLGIQNTTCLRTDKGSSLSVRQDVADLAVGDVVMQ